MRKAVFWVEREQAVLGMDVGTYNLMYHVCLCFPVRMVRKLRHFTMVPCVHCGYKCYCLPLSWPCFGVRSPVGCAPEAAGAACTASSSKGANAWPVMSGVTRPWFQNTAVNKVKVSPFAGKEVCFYELDSTWMK